MKTHFKPKLQPKYVSLFFENDSQPCLVIDGGGTDEWINWYGTPSEVAAELRTVANWLDTIESGKESK